MDACFVFIRKAIVVGVNDFFSTVNHQFPMIPCSRISIATVVDLKGPYAIGGFVPVQHRREHPFVEIVVVVFVFFSQP